MTDEEGYTERRRKTAKLRNLITKRGTLEILIPLCCSTEPVRYKKFRETLKGIGSKTLAYRLQELKKGGILEMRFVSIRLTGEKKDSETINVHSLNCGGMC